MQGHSNDLHVAGRPLAERDGGAAEWVSAHSSQMPERLSERMREALRGVHAQSDSGDARAAALAGIGILQAVLQRGEGSRADALDLLAADALVTLACELAAEHPESLESISGEIIGTVLAALATTSHSEGVQ